MKALEKCNNWVSDGTYLAFEYFLKNLLPNFITMGIKASKKVIFIPLENKEDGFYVGTYFLGRINYHEFISYLYGLSSFKAFRLKNIEGIPNNYVAPFDLEGLIRDYYNEMQCDEYFSCVNGSISPEESTTSLAYSNFKSNIIRDILKDAMEGKYKLEDLLDVDGTTIVTRFISIPLEIRYDDFFIGRHNLGKINPVEFLNYLTSMPSYVGMRSEGLDQEISFNLEQLFIDFNEQNISR